MTQTLEELLAKRRAERDVLVLANLDRLTCQTKAVKMIDLEEHRMGWMERFTLITREVYPSEVAKGNLWRATRFDAIGPSGHDTFKTLVEAVLSYSGEWIRGVGPCNGRMQVTEVR